MEILEPRQLLYATLANGMPILDSYPSAPAALFLDFDGHPGREYAEPWSLDADGSTFNAEEQAIIYESWRRTSLYYSMFNINVTTIQPSASTPKAWLTMSPTYPGDGIATVNSFPSSGPTGYVPEKNFLKRTAAHEAGHMFGNWHISSYNSDGEKYDTYANPPGEGYGPYGHIMGGGGALGKWTIWHESQTNSPATILDTMAVIAHDLDNYGGDGFRPDDVGGTIATADPLPFVGDTQMRTAVLERLTDTDVFSFVSTGGTYNIAVMRDAPAAPDTKVTIYNSSGIILATEDGDPCAVPEAGTYDSYLTMDLAAGDYYVAVSSRGNQGDQGQYIIRVDPMADGWKAEEVGFTGTPGYSSYDQATGTFTVAGSGYDIGGTEDDLHFLYQTLTGDGSITARVTSLSNSHDYAQGGLMIRDSLAADAKRFGLVLTQDEGMGSYLRTSTGGNTTSYYPQQNTAFAPSWIRITRSGNLFTTYQSDNGVDWIQFGSARTVTMGSTVYIGLAAAEAGGESTENRQLNVATFTDVSLTGDLNVQPNEVADPADLADYNHNGIVDAADYTVWRDSGGDQSGYDLWRAEFGMTGLAPPAGLSVSTITSNSVRLTWSDVAGETGYSIERSSDNVTFTEVATVGADVTSYINTGLSDFERYYFRVRAENSDGVSKPSEVRTALTLAGAVTHVNFISWTSDSIVLDWADAGGETGYRIQQSDNGVTNWTTRGDVAKNIPIFADSGLSADTTYYYRVLTMQGANVTAISSVVHGDTMAAGAGSLAPTIVGADETSLAWDAASLNTPMRGNLLPDSGTKPAAIGRRGSLWLRSGTSHSSDNNLLLDSPRWMALADQAFSSNPDEQRGHVGQSDKRLDETDSSVELPRHHDQALLEMLSADMICRQNPV